MDSSGPVTSVDAAIPEQLRQFWRYATDVMFVADGGRRLTWVSPSVQHTLGRDPSGLVGRSLDDLIHPDDLSLTDGAGTGPGSDVSSVIRATEPLRALHASGAYVWCTATLVLTRDAAGDVVAVSGALSDVDSLVAARLAASDAEARLHSVVNALMEPLVTLRAVRTEDGRILALAFEDVNEAAAEWLGVRTQELLGRSIDASATAAGDGPDFAACVDVLTSGEPVVMNDVATTPRDHAGQAWVDVRIVAVDADLVAYTWRDVSHRHVERARLEESEARFRLLVENSSDVVYLSGPDGLVTWVAPTVAGTLGWTPTQIVGRAMLELIHPQDRGWIAEARDAAYAGSPLADSGRYLARLRAEDGSYRWMSIRNELVHGADGSIVGVSGSMRDVDELVSAQRAAERANDTLRAVFDGHDPQVLLRALRDVDGRVVDFTFEDANSAACAFEHMPHHLLVGRTVREVYRSMREAEEDIAYCVEALRTGAAIVVDDMITEGYVDGHGRDIVVDVRVVPIDEDSVSYGWRDVTERHVAQRRLAESEERLRLLAENMSDVVSLVREDLIEWISPSVTHSLGWQQSDLVGGSPGDMLEPDDAARMQSIWADVTEGTLPRLRCRVRCADGSRRWMDIDGSLVGDGERRTIVLAARLVDAEVHALEELETLARRDALTGLINRHAIFEQIGRALAGSVRSGNRVAFVFCDLDEFKDVNDAHGHAAGDAVLRTIAQRLENAVRAGDVIARMGGDEFLVVLNGVHDLENATLIAQKLHDEVGRPIEIHDGCVAVGSSMGVTLAEEGETLDDIIARADAHMYSAKRGGKDQVITLDPGEPG